jgi:hypothetical protein
MAAAPNGNVYAVVSGGDIYMQTNGTGNFVALSQTSRVWVAMAAAPNGNVYAVVSGGDIYMQTNGTGNFVALSQTTRNWVAMAAAPNGNVYAAVYGGDIYMQTGGTGNFVALSQTTRNWWGITAAPNENVYANVDGGDIYKQTNDLTAGSDKAGGSLVLSSGAGKGTGASNIIFNTSTPLSSGTTLQTLSEKMRLTGAGNLGIGTTNPFEKLHVIGNVLINGTINATSGASFGGRVGIGTVNPGSYLEVLGDAFINGTANKLYFGVSKASSISYDGTNLNINPKEVGTGQVNILGNLNITGNLSVKRPYWNGYDNSTQNFLNTANVQIINISNNNDFDAYGIHVVGSQNLTFDMSGDYICILSPEFFQNGGGSVITFWYQKNGVDVRWSNSRFTMSNNQYTAPAIPYQFDITNPATDNIRFMWWSDSTNTQIYSSGALTSPTRPSIPGILLNCQKNSEITE